MLNENEYFENLEKAGEAYAAKVEALNAKKLQLVKEYGYDSDQVRAWYDEKNALVYPFNGGEGKAYRAWEQSVENNYGELVMDDFLWDKEVPEFLEALKAAGVKHFVYTNASTSSMSNMQAFINTGCQLDGARQIKKVERRFGQDQVERVFGIRFTIW